jgi:hypothetical protein
MSSEAESYQKKLIRKLLPKLTKLGGSEQGENPTQPDQAELEKQERHTENEEFLKRTREQNRQIALEESRKLREQIRKVKTEGVSIFPAPPAPENPAPDRRPGTRPNKNQTGTIFSKGQ